jgi:hypothetical protein
MTTPMPTALAYERLHENLAEAVPALGETVQAELNWWGDEPAPSHVLFAEVLAPYLTNRLANDDVAALAPAFAFLERMASDVDPRIQDVLRDTVLEHLRDEPEEHRERAVSAMGPSTLTHWRQLAGEP